MKISISGIPLLAELTDLPDSGTSTETGQKDVPIHEDDISTVLWQRWIACYMLYDWNLSHADSAYLSNKCTWVQKVCRRLEGTAIDAASLEGVLTDTFNHILLEDVEDFIETHMKVWKCDRMTVEFQAAKVIAEIFTVKPQAK
ncbi:MAG TPA: hypothetical protein DCZ91_04360 [Lachnospiraceae bacterium]|nr:hypothetical protein [Lachnospiraceae bacterium]